MVSVSVLWWFRMSAFFSAYIDRQLIFAFSVAQREFCANGEHQYLPTEGFFILLAAELLQQ